jgi:type I restriction enzyme S subunit
MKDELQKGDILLTSEGPMGEMYYLSKNDKYCLSQRLYALRANTKKIDPAYLFFWLQSPLAKSDINGRATGTTVVGIRQSELRKVRVLNPSKKLTQRFQQAIGGSLSMMGLRSKESLSLTSLRDTLLPRLLSGELSVSEAETQLTEAEAPANV